MRGARRFEAHPHGGTFTKTCGCSYEPLLHPAGPAVARLGVAPPVGLPAGGESVRRRACTLTRALGYSRTHGHKDTHAHPRPAGSTTARRVATSSTSLKRSMNRCGAAAHTRAPEEGDVHTPSYSLRLQGSKWSANAQQLQAHRARMSGPAPARRIRVAVDGRLTFA